MLGVSLFMSAGFALGLTSPSTIRVLSSQQFLRRGTEYILITTSTSIAFFEPQPLLSIDELNTAQLFSDLERVVLYLPRGAG